MEQLRTIILSGELGRKFGKYHKLAVNSPAEAVKALCILLKGFRQELTLSRSRGLEYAIFVGKNNISKDELKINSAKDRNIRIVPVIQGSKQAGVLQTIIGVVLVVVGFFYPPAMAVGIAMTLGGVVQMLTPQASTNSNKADNGTSYNFNGPVNTSAEGVPVPLLYGKCLVGGAVISGGIMAQDQI